MARDLEQHHQMNDGQLTDRLKENPLKERICNVFSRDGSGNMTFGDFRNMCSLFNEQCPRNAKIHYAFQIYDRWHRNPQFICTKTQVY